MRFQSLSNREKMTLVTAVGVYLAFTSAGATGAKILTLLAEALVHDGRPELAELVIESTAAASWDGIHDSYVPNAEVFGENLDALQGILKELISELKAEKLEPTDAEEEITA